MASKSSYRPRRTRIYGANYDIGESYYKKQLESLDNKRGGSVSRFADDHFSTDFTTNPREEKLTPKVSFLNDNEDANLYKYTPSKAFNNNKAYLDDSDDEFSATPFKAGGSRFTNTDSVKLGDSIRKDFYKKSLDVKDRTPFGNDLDNQGFESFTSRRLKIKSENVLFDNQDSSAALEATSRAKATKARLADLESEMLNITEKQNEREKRNFSLRKLLNESESSDTFKAITKI